MKDKIINMMAVMLPLLFAVLSVGIYNGCESIANSSQVSLPSQTTLVWASGNDSELSLDITTSSEETFTLVQTTVCDNETESETSNIDSGKININTATLSMLIELPGIGETKAAAIIEYRDTYGSFFSISEITNVSGIGDKTYEKIKELITV